MDEARTNWTGVLFGFTVAVVSAFHQMKVPPVLPEMLAAYGYDALVAGGFMSIYAVTGIAVALALGGRMQRHGALAFLYGGLALALAGSAWALAWPANGWSVLGARGLEGLGAGILAIAGPAYCTSHASARHLPVAAGLTATWIPIGALAAAGLAAATAGGDPASGAQWRAVWRTGIAITLALAGWTVWLHLRGAANLSVPAGPGTRPRPAPPPGDADRSRDRARDRIMALVAVVFFLWSWEFIGFFTWLPERMVSVLGQSGQGAAGLYAVPFAFVAVFNLVAAAALRRGVPVTGLLIVALAVPAVFLALMPVAGGGWPGAVVLALFGAFVGLIPTALFSLPAHIYGRAQAGPRAFGVLMIGRNMGGIVGPLSVAALVRLGADWPSTILFLTVIQLGAAAAALVLHRRLAALGRS
ncbi:MAG: MFS transporter [Hyphomicrobiales bacterium]|nr:MFS transporter [Hyphomicrobiales bacterium]MCP5371601.1 MFS transporter [Hyphomicrobiales bacterium]